MAQDTQQKRTYLDYSGLTYYTKKVMSWFGVLSIAEIDEIITRVESGDCADCNLDNEKTEENN
jgi:hypothetical protein